METYSSFCYNKKFKFSCVHTYLGHDFVYGSEYNNVLTCFHHLMLCLFLSFLFRYENELIVALGKGEPALVMSEYGFK